MPAGADGTGPGERRRPVHHVEQVMGTAVTFDVYEDPAGSSLHLALARARALLHRADAVFSLWKPNSPMSRLRAGLIRVEEAPREVAEVLELCAAARVATHGWFDAEAQPGGLDPTGLVKGWAAQRALEVLVEAGHHDAMVNAGGDIATCGAPQDLPAWRIGIQHPVVRDALIGVVEVAGSIATSGTYERGAHLVDPFTGRSSARYASATVTGPSLALADAVATALAVAGDEGFAFVEELDGYEALTVDARGAVRTSSEMHLAPVSTTN